MAENSNGVCLLSTNSFSQLLENPIANIAMLLVAAWLVYKVLPKVKALYKNKKEDEKVMYVAAYVAIIPTIFFAGLYLLRSGWSSAGFFIAIFIALVTYPLSKRKDEALVEVFDEGQKRKKERKRKKKNTA
jgi:hypothetical protein